MFTLTEKTPIYVGRSSLLELLAECIDVDHFFIVRCLPFLPRSRELANAGVDTRVDPSGAHYLFCRLSRQIPLVGLLASWFYPITSRCSMEFD